MRISKILFMALALGFFMTKAVAAPVEDPKEIQAAIKEAYTETKIFKEGEVANYIPELGKVNPELFAIVVVTKDGKIYSVGDVKYAFAIESISKLFMFGLAVKDRGEQFLIDKIGVYETGLPFNSVIAGVVRAIKEQNPFVNYGAIQVSSLIRGKDPADKWNRMLAELSDYAGGSLVLGTNIYNSETETNFNNRALAQLARANNRFYSEVMDAVDRYTKACSVLVTTEQLAMMGATLANDGKNPITGKQVIEEQYVPRMLALMVTTGLYDESGYWNYTVGVPGKSGVGGGILAIVPNHYAIAVFSPRLDASGNSVRGIKAMQYLSKRLHLSIYN